LIEVYLMVAPLKTEASQVLNVLIGKDGADHVRIKIALPPLDRRDVEGQGHDVKAEVEIRSGPFSGAFRSFFSISELAAFTKHVEGIYNALSGTVTLRQLEGQLNLKMEHRGLGHIRVQGHARGDAAWYAVLHFDFEIDQTFLPKIVGELAPILNLARP
jgi:hypothetical protein